MTGNRGATVLLFSRRCQHLRRVLTGEGCGSAIANQRVHCPGARRPSAPHTGLRQWSERCCAVGFSGHRACLPSPLWRCKPSAARWPSACHIHLSGPEWGPLHTGGDASELGPVVRALSVGVYRRQTTTGLDRRRADCQAVAPDPASGGTCRLCHTTSNGCALANRHRLAPIAPKRRRPRRGASSCRACGVPDVRHAEP
jgi:hypothetical protein